MSSIQRVRKLVSSNRASLETETGRSAERHRRAILTSASGVVARVAAMSASLITIPLTLHYLGSERFGLWMAISAVIALASFADLGIGNGVLNTVAEASGRDDQESIRRAISSGFAVLTMISWVLLTVFFIAYRFVPWADIFRVTSPLARSEAGPAMIAFAVCFALNIPLDIVQRVQLGLQEGYRTNLWQICGSSASLIGIVCAVYLHRGVPGIILAFAGAPVIGVALNALYFFGISRRDLIPRWTYVDSDIIRKILRLGGMFFLIQVVITLSFSTDSFIIARTLGAASVAGFAIPQRMFSVISVVIFTFVMPLWPAYGEAASRGDIAWVRRTLFRTMLAVFGGSFVVSAILLAFAHPILHLWVGSSVQPGFALLLGLAVWEIVRSCTGTLQMFLNGAGFMHFQMITHCIFGVACVGAKYWCASHYGAAGVPWAGIVTYILFIVVPNTWCVPQLLRQMSAAARSDSTISLGAASS